MPLRPRQLGGRIGIACSLILVPLLYSSLAGAEKKVKLVRDGDAYLIDNGLIAVKVPGRTGQRAPPISSVRFGKDRWAGRGGWQVFTVFNNLHPIVEADGTEFARVTLKYYFNDPNYGGPRVLSSFITVTLNPDEPFVHVEEAHDMQKGDYWSLEIGRELATCELLVSRAEPDKFIRMSTDAAQIGPDLYDRYSFFAATNQRELIGVLAMRAERWQAALDNSIRVEKVAKSEEMRLIFPTWHGSRRWVLMAGPVEKMKNVPGKLWHGLPAGVFPKDKPNQP